ncbi:hypothetical protein C1H46_020852 [Malus baccata]|uniref:Uncharacterized protein n=1 Tax=Malus baccata TaxID=106549 RepID=A0A540M445_MALBA|nr:hypothetical protein C1H46_020852 [Malus baccata]
MADEEGPERGEINGGPASMDSIESRWVFQDEDDSDLDDDDAEAHAMHRTVVDSEDDEEEDDNAEQRLIRTGPRVDSFDVEALEVPGALRNEYENLLYETECSYINHIHHRKYKS